MLHSTSPRGLHVRNSTHHVLHITCSTSRSPHLRAPLYNHVHHQTPWSSSSAPVSPDVFLVTPPTSQPPRTPTSHQPPQTYTQPPRAASSPARVHLVKYIFTYLSIFINSVPSIHLSPPVPSPRYLCPFCCPFPVLYFISGVFSLIYIIYIYIFHLFCSVPMHMCPCLCFL